jgi:hypothetical protein
VEVRLRVILDLLDVVEAEVDDDTDSSEVKVIQEIVEISIVDGYAVSVSVGLLLLVVLPGGP